MIPESEERRRLPTRDAIAELVRARTHDRPPLPGLIWTPSFSLTGELRDWTLHVDRERYEAFAPRRDSFDRSARRPGAEQLGETGYREWLRAGPSELQRADAVPWQQLPAVFRKQMAASFEMLWQLGENHGYMAALERTLPSGRLGAAGILEDLADAIQVQHGAHGGSLAVAEVLVILRSRADELRAEQARQRRRERER